MKHIFYLSVACYKTEKKKLYTYIKKEYHRTRISKVVHKTTIITSACVSIFVEFWFPVFTAHGHFFAAAILSSTGKKTINKFKM